MTRYDYFESVCSDIRAYIADNSIEVNSDNRDELHENLYNDMWVDDSVTGNGSGSYTFNTWKAEENLCHNMSVLAEACEEFGGNCAEWLARGAEFCDVSIRCYLLSSCLSVVLDELCEE